MSVLDREQKRPPAVYQVTLRATIYLEAESENGAEALLREIITAPETYEPYRLEEVQLEYVDAKEYIANV